MQIWYERALRAAMAQAHSSQQGSLESDLSRILQQLEEIAVPIFRNVRTDEIIDQIEDAFENEELLEVLNRICDAYGFQCMAVFFPFNYKRALGVKVVTNFPRGWVNEYTDRNYAAIDPVALATSIHESFFWNELEVVDPISVDFFRRASLHGVGPIGFTFSVPIDDELKASVSICARGSSETEFENIINFNFDDLREVLRTFGNRVVFLFDLSVGSKMLNAEALNVLQDIASGVAPEEVAKRRVSYGNFRAFESSICNALRCRTIFQAAVVAEKLGLLAEPHLCSNEVISIDEIG